ncbi:hypothetical protein ABK040_000608 [Willaertia magna]
MNNNNLKYKSLLLYRLLLKKSSEFALRNRPSPERSYRICYYIPGQEITEFLLSEIKKQFRQAQRLFNEKKKPLEYFEKQLNDGYIMYKGLERGADEAFNQTHNKRKAIKLSPIIHLLKLACVSTYGNYHYHQKLREIFLAVTLQSYKDHDIVPETVTIDKKKKKKSFM